MKTSRAISIYVERKRAGGLCYFQTAAILRHLARQVDDRPLDRLTKRDISSFLDRGTSPHGSFWVQKYHIVKNFLAYWRLRGHVNTFQMPAPRRRPVSTFMPLVYSHVHLQRILSATALSQSGHRRTSVDPFTLRTLLQFLYGTGVLITEALNLQLCDVDLNENMITLRRTNIGTSRRIPIGRGVRTILSRHLRSSVSLNRQTMHFFLNRGGGTISYQAVYRSFSRVCRYADITRRDGGRYRPRIRDLRFTFAVNRLTSWLKAGVRIEPMLPALAQYLGEVDLSSMEKYLALTPERFRGRLRSLAICPANFR